MSILNSCSFPRPGRVGVYWIFSESSVNGFKLETVQMIHKIAVGVSGGIDSAVAAYLLKQKGFNVRGVFMKNWDLVDEHGKCPGEQDLADAEWICKSLQIPLIVANFVKEYWNNVFGTFLQEYEQGVTPNPDILCNRYIKFDAFYEYCRNHLNVDAIATGHYARTTFGSYLEQSSRTRGVKLLQPIDKFKDQTFFLSQVPQSSLARTMFPLGELNKNQVKEIAKQIGLDRIVKKRESTGICFIGKRNFTEFISEYINNKPGNFINSDTGDILGVHNGFHHWTVGQRSRLDGNKKPLFIQRKMHITNEILLSAGTDHPSLFTNLFYTDYPYWIDKSPFETAITECTFRFQHTKPLVKCKIIPIQTMGIIKEETEKNVQCNKRGGLLVSLEKPLRALTPGQYAVFYLNNECLGAARILSPGPSIVYDDNQDNRQKIENSNIS